MDEQRKDTGRCYICGYDNPNGLHEHHIVPRSIGGPDEPENLVFLCGSCHQALHKLYGQDFFERFGAGLGGDKVETRQLDFEGTQIDPKNSFDRSIPELSEHVHFEDFHYTFTLDDLDEYLDVWRDLPEWDYVGGIEPWRDYIVRKIDEVLETAREALNGDSGLERFVIESEDPRTNPELSIIDESDLDEDEAAIMRGWVDRHQRVHCSYCHTVFSADEVSNMACHLRVYHGVADPYAAPTNAIAKEFFEPSAEILPGGG